MVLVAKLAPAFAAALLGCTGFSGPSWKSGALSTESAPVWPPEISGADTLSEWASYWAVYMLDKSWCQSQLTCGSKKPLPCCIILEVLGK